jgi:NADH-quinone oxidoreductase subunit L
MLLAVGFATAFLTAVYTSMAFFRTFYGAEKIPAAAGDHAHEASNTMLMPMAVLALGALSVGLLLGPTGWLGGYITETPYLHHGEHSEPLWILVASALLALGGVALGYRMSKLGTSASPINGLAFVYWGRNRLYIDWFYERVIVAPMEWFAGVCGWLDRFVDAFIQVVADSPRWLGLAGQRLQTGRVPTYSFFTAIGIAALAIWIVTRSHW